MESHFPTNKASTVPGPRMWIGEYGWGADTFAQQEPLNRAYIQRLLGWNSERPLPALHPLLGDLQQSNPVHRRDKFLPD